MNSPASLRIRVRPCTVVYAVLVLLTVVTWTVGEAQLQGLPVALLVLLLALVKGQLIGDWFMGLRAVSGLWRWAISLWLVVLGGLLTAAFVMASGG